MKSDFIRFVTKKEYLLDDIKNGFKLREHPISFRSSIYTILPSLIEFWDNNKIQHDAINVLKDQYRNLDKNDFWKWWVQKMKDDISFNLGLSYLTTQLNDVKIKMKCFTELRDNQKLHPDHRKFGFGKYGISLKQDWLTKNDGNPVIYTNKDSETTNRLARLTSMLLSVPLCRQDGVITAIFDVLAFTEIKDHLHEYEWRIVGNHNVTGKSYRVCPETVPFNYSDIDNIYVPEISEIREFKDVLSQKATKDKCDILPKVKLTETIYLTDAELDEIDAIYLRR